MATKAEKTGAVPFTEEIGGKEWTFSPLDHEALLRLMAHARSRRKSPLAVVTEEFANLPESVRKEALREAIQLGQQRDRPLTNEQWEEYLATDEGTAYFLRLSLEPNHPKITEQKVIDAIAPEFNENNVRGVEIITNILERSGLIEKAPAKKNGKAKRKRKKGA